MPSLLDVHLVPPSFIEPTQTENHQRFAMFNNSNFSLACRASGFPVPELELVYVRSRRLDHVAREEEYTKTVDRITSGVGEHGAHQLREAVFRWNIERFRNNWTCSNVETFTWPEMA